MAEEIEKLQQAGETYKPSDKNQEIIKGVYSYLDDMIEKRNQTYRDFNDRTLVQYIDAGDKRLNAYTVDRDSYDPPKEAWQSNVALPTVKDKQMKLLAGFSLTPPDMEVKSYYHSEVPDIDRASLSKWLIWGSYMQQSNPTLDTFWEGWEAARTGTVVVYEGYMRSKLPQKFITSYDLETGVIEYEERDVTVDDQCFSYNMPLTEFYISSFYEPNVQKQTRVAWVRDVDREALEREFSKNPNLKYVLTGKQVSQISNADQDSFYLKSKWDSRVDENRYEIVRMYDKGKDSYRVIVNGVLMLDAPLLWRINGKKVYPFAKTIFAPLVSAKFFYGQSVAGHMEGLYDEYNTLWNTMTDNQYRRMVRALLVGRVNADALNLEEEYITNSTKISVEDVSQVKELSVGGIDQADISMLKLIGQAIDQSTPDMPSLLGNKQATAREVVIANERIQELKTIYSELLVDLWRQKYPLRLANIKQNYPVRRSVFDEKTNKVVEKPRTYIVEGAVLNKQRGEIGTLSVVFDNLSEKEQAKAAESFQVEEESAKKQGINLKKQIVPTDYLDNADYQITVITASVYRQGLAAQQATLTQKIGALQQLFPQYFIAMSDTFIGEFASAFGDDPEKYKTAMADFQAKAAKAAEEAAAAEGGGEPALAGATATEGAPGGTGEPPAPPQG